jgi:hypothetical protein
VGHRGAVARVHQDGSERQPLRLACSTTLLLLLLLLLLLRALLLACQELPGSSLQ